MAAALPFAVYVGGMPAGPLAGHYSDRLGAGRVLVVSGLIVSLAAVIGAIWYYSSDEQTPYQEQLNGSQVSEAL